MLDDRFFSCQNKQVYGSLNAAQKAAHDLRRRKRVRMSPYRCDHCGKYHLFTDR